MEKMEKKPTSYEPRILVIEDDQGMRTSYYPGLAWNGLGYSFPCESPVAVTRFGDIDRAKKIFSAKTLLRDISENYESASQSYAIAPEKFLLENRAYLHSNLLDLIGATDGNEDSVGHSQLVSLYTLLLTKSLGIDDRVFCVQIERGALLHDIGKIGIPDSILRKAGPLTVKEREIIKEHPLLGYEMVEEFPFLQKASRVVLFHHESYNGQGYPYGLKGEEIPLEARIFAVADTLDAITSDRPYRKGKSFRAAFDEIERVRGIQFDPQIVDALFSVPVGRWQRIKDETEQSLSAYSLN